MNEDKINALIDLMSDLSEDIWCAGWLMDCEYVFWEWVQDGKNLPELKPIKILSDEINGWVHWPNDDKGHPIGDGPVFVALDKWQGMYKTWRNTQEIWRRR